MRKTRVRRNNEQTRWNIQGRTCPPLTPWIPVIPVSPCTRRIKKKKQFSQACEYLISWAFTSVSALWTDFKTGPWFKLFWCCSSWNVQIRKYFFENEKQIIGTMCCDAVQRVPSSSVSGGLFIRNCDLKIKSQTSGRESSQFLHPFTASLQALVASISELAVI